MAVAFAVAIAFVVVKQAPQWLASTEGLVGKDRAEELGRARAALLAALAGTIAIVGAYYTARTFGLHRQGHITERFTRAVDQLGHTHVDVRLGGIYALERLARESRVDHGPIIEILTAHVREHAPAPAGNRAGRPASRATPDFADSAAPARAAPDTPRPPANDVQAIISVLHRRKGKHDPPLPWRLDLREVELFQVNLEETSLQLAMLIDARLEAADLRRVRLEEALLADAHLEGADLRGAHLECADLRGAHLQRADLSGAHLEGAVYSAATRWPDGFDPKAAGAFEQPEPAGF